MFTNKLKAARELSFDGQTAAKSSAPFKAQLHFISRCMQQVTYTVVYSLHALTLPLFIILYDTADSVVALHQKETIPAHHDAATIDICHYPAARLAIDLVNFDPNTCCITERFGARNRIQPAGVQIYIEFEHGFGGKSRWRVRLHAD